MKYLIYTLLFIFALTSCGVGNFSQRNHIKKVRVAKLETKKNGEIVPQEETPSPIQILESREIATLKNNQGPKETIETSSPRKELELSTSKAIATKVAEAKQVKKFNELTRLIKEAKDEIAASESNPYGKLAATFSIITLGLLILGVIIAIAGNQFVLYYLIPGFVFYLTTIILSIVARKRKNDYPNSTMYARFGENVGITFAYVLPGVIIGILLIGLLESLA